MCGAVNRTGILSLRVFTYLPLPGSPPFCMWSQTLFYLTPVVVFGLTAAIAIWRFRIFRTGKPAIKIDLEMSSRPASPSWTVLSALALVQNTSQVMARCNSLQWEVRVLSPFDDEAVELKVAEYSSYMTTEGPSVEFPWNVQYRIVSENPGIALEPGEFNVVDMSLALPRWIDAVDVRCTLVLPKGRRGPPYVWTNRKPHDICKEVTNDNRAD